MASQSSNLNEVPDIIRSICYPGLQPRPWLPGQSGNPGGRVSYRRISDALYKQLDTQLGPDTTATKVDALAESMVDRAIIGDVQAATFVRDTTEGRPAQQINLDGNLLIESADERKQRMLAVLTALAELSEEP